MVKLLKRAEQQNNLQAQNCNGFVHFNMPEFTGTDWYVHSDILAPIDGREYRGYQGNMNVTLIEDYSVGYL